MHEGKSDVTKLSAWLGHKSWIWRSHMRIISNVETWGEIVKTILCTKKSSLEHVRKMHIASSNSWPCYPGSSHPGTHPLVAWKTHHQLVEQPVHNQKKPTSQKQYQLHRDWLMEVTTSFSIQLWMTSVLTWYMSPETLSHTGHAFFSGPLSNVTQDFSTE